MNDRNELIKLLRTAKLDGGIPTQWVHLSCTAADLLEADSAVFDALHHKIDELQRRNSQLTMDTTKADKLRSYEQTGLSPENIRKMTQELKQYIRTVWLTSKRVSEYEKLQPFSRLKELSDADKDHRCVILSEPMLPLEKSDISEETLCPNCHHDLSGGFVKAGTDKVVMFQCPYCWHPVDTTRGRK